MLSSRSFVLRENGTVDLREFARLQLGASEISATNLFGRKVTGYMIFIRSEGGLGSTQVI